MLGRAANCTIECTCDVLDKNRPDTLITIDMADFSLKSCHDISVGINRHCWNAPRHHLKRGHAGRVLANDPSHFLRRCHAVNMNDMIRTVILNVSHKEELYIVRKRPRMYRMLGAKWEGYDDDARARAITFNTFPEIP
jgi:hypothetical protein